MDKQLSVISNSVVQKLNSFESLAEEKFIKYGNLINKNNLDFRNIITSVNETIAVISSPEVLESIHSLNNLTKELQDKTSLAKEETNKSQKSLSFISGQLESVNNILDDYEGFVKGLKMLGLSAKIESARITDMDTDFDNLVENVESLSNRIDEKSKLIGKKSLSLYKLIGSVSSNIRILNKTNDETVQTILEKSDHSISVLREKFQLAQHESELISNYAQKISKIFGDIVVSIQYQDICKQQIDHVCEALNSVVSENCSGLAYPAESNSKFNKGNTIHNIYSIQKAQLQNTKTEFLEASHKLISDLQEIEHMTANLESMIVNLLQNGENEKDSYLYKTGKELKKIIDIVIKNSQADSKLIELVESLNETKNELSRFVGDVEDIGAEIELIAINSQIKSARLGKEGMSLGIIAENIQKLSVRAKEQTDNLSADFKSINKEAEFVSDTLLNSSGSSKRLSDDLVKNTVDEIFNRITGIQNKSIRNFNEINKSLGHLRNNVLEEEEIKEFGKYSEKEFDDIISSLTGIINSIDPGTSARENFNVHLDRLKDNYTMRSERKIHDSIGNNNSSNEQKINKEPGGGHTSEFGDNVELF